MAMVSVFAAFFCYWIINPFDSEAKIFPKDKVEEKYIPKDNLLSKRSDDSKYFQKEPPLLAKGRNENDALLILEKALGISDKKKIVEVVSPIESILIDKDYLRHIVEKRDNARERYANYIIPTLVNPYEIYLTQFEKDIRRQYIGLFKGKYNLLCSVRINPDGSLLWNMMNSKNMDSHRKGSLIYYNKKGG
jgi:hypothetical protein